MWRSPLHPRPWFWSRGGGGHWPGPGSVQRAALFSPGSGEGPRHLLHGERPWGFCAGLAAGLHLPVSLDPQVHVGGSLAVLGGKLYVSGGYDNTFELSDVVEAYDPETRAWSIVGRLPEPTFWHGSVSIFRQFMPQVPSGGRGFELDSGSSDMDVARPRRPQNPDELH